MKKLELAKLILQIRDETDIQTLTSIMREASTQMKKIDPSSIMEHKKPKSPIPKAEYSAFHYMLIMQTIDALSKSIVQPDLSGYKSIKPSALSTLELFVKTCTDDHSNFLSKDDTRIAITSRLMELHVQRIVNDFSRANKPIPSRLVFYLSPDPLKYTLQWIKRSFPGYVQAGMLPLILLQDISTLKMSIRSSKT